jgi:hypothetical protein
MPEYLAPGVYVEEIPLGTKPIEGVSTSTSDFIGTDLCSRLHRAVVQSNVDPEQRGRVLVTIPAVSAEPRWAALLVTGNHRNVVFSPGIGDEVIVAFVEGDLRSPICLGSLWNGASPPEGECK